MISGNTGPAGNFAGVQIEPNSTSNKIIGNRIGTKADGNSALDTGNGTGVLLFGGAQGNQIGGLNEGERNIISGNTFGDFQEGVTLLDPFTKNNIVLGNYIGTNAGGTGTVPNGTGVLIDFGAGPNTIGSATEIGANVISGNNESGVWIVGNSSGNVVAGNYIGVNSSALSALANFNGVSIEDQLTQSNTTGPRNLISANTNAGVKIDGAEGNTVSDNFIGTNAIGTGGFGGQATQPYGVRLEKGPSGNQIGIVAGGNIISGNKNAGIQIRDVGSDFNSIQGNFIGTDVSGTLAIGNGDSGDGIIIEGGAQNNQIEGAGTAGNLISANKASGVDISGSGTMGNLVQGNYIGTDKDGGTSSSIGLGNGSGITLSQDASFNTIGDGAGEIGSPFGNLISNNAGAGVRFLLGANQNTVGANRIGTDRTGSVALGNRNRESCSELVITLIRLRTTRLLSTLVRGSR